MLRIVLICVLLSTTKAWLTIEHPSYDNENQTNCIGARFNIGELEIGEIKQLPDVCGIAQCRHDLIIIYRGCNPIAARYPCSITDEDASKPFPECCHQIRCEQE